jgi:hypothetical protein
MLTLFQSFFHFATNTRGVAPGYCWQPFGLWYLHIGRAKIEKLVVTIGFCAE